MSRIPSRGLARLLKTLPAFALVPSLILGAALAAGLATAAGFAPARAATPPSAAPATPPPNPALIAKGLYLVRAADCQACHTAPGGTPFAGGQYIGTPFGAVTSPNITPDPDTGIGSWTEADFYRALHEGIGRHGEYLYPVMPYPSYTRITRADVHAIWAYLQTLRPVFSPRLPGTLRFPYDIRATLVVWRELYFNPGTFRPEPDRSSVWNRGAYLVTGPGHCSACHSPRTLLGGTEVSESYAGGYAQDWLAPNISASRLDGLGLYSAADIEEFLKTGHAKSLGVAFGPMAEVVRDSTRYLTDSDLTAMATYLIEGPRRRTPRPGSVATTAELRRGRTLYLENCAQCHQDHGIGISGVVPSLAGNQAISAAIPNDVILAVLGGLSGVGGNYTNMPSFAGALGNQDIADIVNYVRTAWTNSAPANATPDLVAHLRETGGVVGLAGSESARAFDCPRVGAGPVPQVVATPDDVAMLSAGDPGRIAGRLTALIQELRAEDPSISSGALINTLVASYCPVVANLTGLTVPQKRQRMTEFATTAQDEVLSLPPAEPARVVVPVSLSPAAVRGLQAKASASHETVDQYLTGLATGEAAGAAPRSP
jgi:mono/diheme cytochrome c family protein